MSEQRFSQPPGFLWNAFANHRGAHIRHGHAAPAGAARGTVVILPGFREPAEKYFEAMRDLLARGFAVRVMDWRGQGGSGRYLKNEPFKAHHEGYDEQIATLHAFMKDTAEKAGGGPFFMLAHSMGAHIGLRYLAAHPGVFDSALLTAPMADVRTGPFPRPLARQMARFARAGNRLEKYVPGGGPWREGKEAFDGNHKTSDPVRFRVQEDLFRDNPNLQLGDVTYGWVFHTFQSIDALNAEGLLESVSTPVLMQISGADRVVDAGAARRAAARLPACTTVEIPAARHEIWMERDALRGVWLAELESFLDARLKGRASAPKKKKERTGP